MDIELAAQLQKGNLLFFEKPVHVALGELHSVGISETSKYLNIIEVSTYGIHLIELDPHTKVGPIEICWPILNRFNFSIHNGPGRHYYIKLPTLLDTKLVLKYIGNKNGFLTKLVFTGGGVILPYIKYVHSLQNLYASLCPGHYLKLN